MSATDRALTDDEFYDGCLRVALRLERHLSAWEDGDDIAGDDLATVVRTVLAKGPANSLIQRLVRRSGASEPSVLVVPLKRNKNTVLAIGGVPLDDRQDIHPDSTRVPITRWMGTELFYSTSLPKRGISVADFANVCGTRFGSHLHPSIPRDLETMRTQRLGFQSVADLLLWTLGAAAQRGLDELLAGLGLNHRTRARNMSRDDAAFAYLTIDEEQCTDETKYKTEIGYLHGARAIDGPVFTYEIAGAEFHMDVQNEQFVLSVNRR